MKAHEHMGSGGQETISDTDNSKNVKSGDQEIKENREYQKCYSKKKRGTHGMYIVLLPLWVVSTKHTGSIL